MRIWPIKNSLVNTSLLVLFFALWLYTEVSEHLERDTFYEEVSNFMYRGDRFTADDGRKLKARIEAIEDELDGELGQK